MAILGVLMGLVALSAAQDSFDFPNSTNVSNSSNYSIVESPVISASVCITPNWNNASTYRCLAPCPNGTANPEPGGSTPDACQPCAAGLYSFESGQASCRACSSGTFASNAGQTHCDACAARTFSGDGQAVCDSCPRCRPGLGHDPGMIVLFIYVVSVFAVIAFFANRPRQETEKEDGKKSIQVGA